MQLAPLWIDPKVTTKPGCCWLQTLVPVWAGSMGTYVCTGEAPVAWAVLVGHLIGVSEDIWNPVHEDDIP